MTEYAPALIGLIVAVVGISITGPRAVRKEMARRSAQEEKLREHISIAREQFEKSAAEHAAHWSQMNAAHAFAKDCDKALASSLGQYPRP